MPLSKPQNRWSNEATAGLSEPELLLYRSNLLGSDLTVTNFGGGNTSAKVSELDPVMGERVQVLWVKGSGGDLGSMALNGFATLWLGRLLALEGRYEGLELEDAMVALLPHCAFAANPRAASIDTPLHGYMPHAHVDHLHPDAVIAIAASRDGERITQEVFGGTVGWLPWQRPGFDLGLKMRDLVARQPELRGIVLGGHGLFNWGTTARECYDLSIELIGRATDAVNAAILASRPFEGRASVASAPSAAECMLAVRSALQTEGGHKVGHLNRSEEIMEFVNSEALDRLAPMGTSCPDHFLRTKIAPLVWRDGDDLDDLVAGYRDGYRAYHGRHATPDSPAARDANPVVVLRSGLGLLSFAADKATARVSAEFYKNAINVMRGAEALGGYVSLPENEAFAIEYWALEEAKLRRLPPPKPLSGRVALITGAAGGIGSAIARRFAGAGACVMLTDRDESALGGVAGELTDGFGADLVRSAVCDVTDADAVTRAFDLAAREFGGVDLLVANAGLASAASVADTDDALWQRLMGVLVDGYFRVARAAFAHMERLGGGSVVFIGSKNGLAASGGAVAYSTAKGAELHLARGLAQEGAAKGIRVNTVNPDAVLQGSSIWDGAWRAERAADYGVAPDELDGFYRDRSLLKRSVLPDDVAEAALFFATDASAKSTGNILNVDAGNAGAFPR